MAVKEASRQTFGMTAENRSPRLNFSSDVLKRKRHLNPSDLTRVVFSDERFFRWNCTGPSQNRPIWVAGTASKDRSRSRHAHQRAQPAQPKHHGLRHGRERHRFPAVFHRGEHSHQHRVLHSNIGRRVFATFHPWHGHIELVVAGRQRPSTHQPTHQNFFQGAPKIQLAPPLMSSSRAHVFSWSRSARLETLTKVSNSSANFGVFNLQAP